MVRGFRDGVRMGGMKRPPRAGITISIVLSVLAAGAGCDDSPEVVGPPDPDPDPLLSLDLQSNCYGWPAEEFSPDNVAALRAALPAGSKAVEFGVRDGEGNLVQLSTLLESKPVVLVLGTFT